VRDGWSAGCARHPVQTVPGGVRDGRKTIRFKKGGRASTDSLGLRCHARHRLRYQGRSQLPKDITGGETYSRGAGGRGETASEERVESWLSCPDKPQVPSPNSTWSGRWLRIWRRPSRHNQVR
jgi:hypothetical protein